MKEEIKAVITDETLLCGRANEINCQIEAKDMRQIVSDIKKCMRKNELKYLSAPAIGYDKRIFCIAFDDIEIKTFINPIIVHNEGLELSRETSPTIPGKTFIRPRNSVIKCLYQSPTGQTNSREFRGLASMIFQQMIDDLDGISLIDVGLEIDEDFDNASDDERQEVIEAYLDSLDLKHQELKKELENDPDAKQIKDAIDFMESVQKGETVLE